MKSNTIKPSQLICGFKSETSKPYHTHNAECEGVSQDKTVEKCTCSCHCLESHNMEDCKLEMSPYCLHGRDDCKPNKVENGEVWEEQLHFEIMEDYLLDAEMMINNHDGKKEEVMRKHYEKLKAFITNALNQQRKNLIDDLGEYLTHTRECVTTGYSAGRPTKDGYEVKIGGKWYESRPVDKTPKCDCGLKEFLTKLEK